MATSLIRNFIAKAIFKQKGAIANRKAVDFSANALETRLKNFGVDVNSIQNEKQLNEILAIIKQREDDMFAQQFGSIINERKSAKVFDLEGKEIKNPKNIMGGKEIKETESQIKTKLEKGNKESIARIKNRKMVEEAIDNASPGFSGDRKYDAQLVADDLAEKKIW